MSEKRKRTIEYDYFFSALKHFLDVGERGTQASLHQETKIAESTISTIVNDKRLATFEQQIKIAKALKLDYIEFLSFGKSIIGGQKPTEKPPPKQDKSSETLVKAAEAFCAVLVEESEKAKKKKRVVAGTFPAAVNNVAGGSG